MSCWVTVFLAIYFLAVAEARAGERLVVHEWGTFTALQDETGTAIGGINTDDEPVPEFVHSLSRWLLISPNEAPPCFFQGAPSCHPDVTMRLETPVIYFHPAPTFSSSVDVHIEFHGGWLTQFFPKANANAPGVTESKFGELTDETIGSLAWNHLALNAKEGGPTTVAHVWTTPRQVEASTIAAEGGEAEKFLFYRGVAHCAAPLQVTRSGEEFVISPNSDDRSAANIRELWLADIRNDGTAAFRPLRPFEPAPTFLVKTKACFSVKEFSVDAVTKLRLAMRASLIASGLFADETDALLNTWELSYFKSAGLRLFFLVPADWTEKHLPLTISPQAEVTRVMVGRIEIVTPEERALLAKIATGPVPDPWKDFRDPLEAKTLRAGNNTDWNDVMDGRKSFSAIGFAVPKLYQAYLSLGRFRNALILDEQRRRPTAELGEFIKRFRLEGYKY